MIRILFYVCIQADSQFLCRACHKMRLCTPFFFIFIWLDLNYVRIYLNKLVTHPLARKLVLHTRKRPGKYPPRSIIVESSQREHLIWYDYEFWPHPLPGGIKERGTCWYRNKTHTCRRGCAYFDKKMSISLSRIVICQLSKGGDIITNL